MAGSVPEVSPAAYVAPGVHLADDVAVAPGAVIHADVRIGAGVQIGSGTIIYPGTALGDGCLIEDGALLGKVPRLRPTSSAARAQIPAALVLEARATVCFGAVVYAGAHLGQDVIIGDQTQIRERAVIGAGSIVGRGSSVDFDVVVGQRVSIQTLVYVTGGTVVEDDVFIGPGVTTTNDHTMARHPPGEALEGPTLRRACRIGGGAVLVPGVEIGEEAFIAAGTVVTADVAPRAVVMGVPGRTVRGVADGDQLERWR